MKEPKRPKTQPTGFRPTPGKKVVKAENTETVGDSLLDAKMVRVKICYVCERQRWESLKAGTNTKYYPSKKYDGVAATKTRDGDQHPEGTPERNSVWATLIKWCESRDINTEEYIRTCFHALEMKHIAPEPRNLMGPVYLNKWVDLSKTLDERLLLALNGQREAVTSRIMFRHKVLKNSYLDASLLAIGAGDLPLSPLFRYCLARKANSEAFAGIVELYDAEAILQFECHPAAYARVWADVLPRKFAERAGRIYPHLLLQLGHRLVLDKPKREE